MKLEHLLLVLLLSLLAIVGVLATYEEPAHSRGLPHPDHEAMSMGGQATSRSLPILWWGLLFVLLQVALFTGLLLLGLRKREQPVVRRFRSVIGAAAALMFCFVMLFVSYRKFALDPEATAIFMGFPTPTAWMLYGVWFTPIIIIVLYRRNFDSWVYGKEDAERFSELLKRSSQEGPS